MPHGPFRRVVGPDPSNGIRGDTVRPELWNELQRALETTPTLDDLQSPVNLQGVLDSAGDLPDDGNTTGDAYLVNGVVWVWSGTEWTNQGSLTTGPQGEPAALRLKGTVATTGDLPASGNVVNDVWVVDADGHGWAWTTDHEWVDIGAFQGPQGEPGADGLDGTDTVLRARVDPGTTGSNRQFTKIIDGDPAWSIYPEFDVRDDGATGDGVTDDTANVLVTLAKVRAAGGGTLRFTGPGTTYLLNTAVTLLPSGQMYILPIDFDNCRIKIDAGVIVKTTLGHANGPALFALRGSYKGALGAAVARDNWGDYWYGKTNPAGHPIYPITAAIAKGALTITTATAGDAGNFAVGDLIYIRTGQTVASSTSEPDAELNEVISVNAGTGVIGLKYPTSKAFAQEYYVSGTSGSSFTLTNAFEFAPVVASSSVANPSVITTRTAHGLSTGHVVTISGHTGSTPDINTQHTITVTSTTTFTIPVNVTVGGTGGKVARLSANAASYGVQKVTGSTVKNFVLEGPGKIQLFPSSNTNTVLAGHQVWGLTIRDIEAEITQGHFQNMGLFRWALARNCQININSTAADRVYFTGSTGVNDFLIDQCTLSGSNAMAYIHLAEGNTGVKIQRTKVRQVTVSSSNALITSGSRGYDIEVADCELVRPGGAALGFSGTQPIDGLTITNVQTRSSSNTISAKNMAIRGPYEDITGTNTHTDTYSPLMTDLQLVTRWVYFDSVSGLKMWPLPNRWFVHDAYVVVQTAFNGTTPTMTLGEVGGTSTRFLSSIDLSTTGKKGSVTGTNQILGGGATGLRTPEILLTLSSATQGRALVVMLIGRAPTGIGV